MAVTLSAGTPVRADVNVTPTVTQIGSGFGYSYRVANTGSAGVLAFFVNVQGSVHELAAPTGWNAGTVIVGGFTRVAWASSDPQYDIGSGQSLAGFSFNSVLGPGGAPYEALDVPGQTFFGTTTGPTCYANCDGSVASPVLNVNDFICFLQRFAAGDTYANCDGSTTPPVLNVNDFVCFQSQFAAGCP
jgi:hypothetical protein